MGLGSNKTHTFNDAREKARLARRRSKTELTPSKQRRKRRADEREQAKRKTVAEACEDYIKSLERKVKKKTGSLSRLKQAKKTINRFIRPALATL